MFCFYSLEEKPEMLSMCDKCLSNRGYPSFFTANIGTLLLPRYKAKWLQGCHIKATYLSSFEPAHTITWQLIMGNKIDFSFVAFNYTDE
jgi:hypothetical protein